MVGVGTQTEFSIITDTEANEMIDKQYTFELLRGTCRREVIKALGKGWDSNRNETRFLESYWENWCAVCKVLGVSEMWWL